ncbi:MAG: hypothetical protein EWV92_06690 [Microcystis aeruginosa Ma_MB_S_20031200_S102]|uniref:Uncharacterized protein n=1 Tax=Microcystis aeruginosa Ma_MB_S_20031200_S102 TaxID=2486254 RepID=A0A552EXG5_MICAE|nr:MAG: hypothetical protein EWV79_00995 [Microcystis aeruginosa Ma_MB_S_20031200_S102D]TRU39138.1 MAG: hypothetical protein EWV92_06690 [Microcystis aeruginosa Ma_MB_S_20031200_S102]
MTILLANLGTSDLSIKVTVDSQNYYFPIDFLSNEPNLNKKLKDLDNERRTIWDNMYQGFNYVPNSQVYQDLGFPTQKQAVRELTKALQSSYQKESHKWHSLIRPTRIGSVIQKAVAMGASKAYIFVTNQPTSHPQDTIYLFQIIQQWVQQEYPAFELIQKELQLNLDPQNPNLEDLVLEYYYNQLNEIYLEENSSQESTILVNVKGGTLHQKTALKIQAIASDFKNLLFIDPILDLNQLLEGKNSECQLTSYWLYQRNQKYQTVKLLLQKRWDFDGARVILKDWQETLIYLAKQVPKIASDTQKEQEKLTEILTRLDFAVSCFNLDKNALKDNEQMEHNFWLNLYTQCRIYWGLDEIANFLIRLSSFYEVTLNELIMGLRGQKYLINNNQNQYLAFDRNKASQEFCNKFEELEPDFKRIKRRDFSYTLVNRYSKRNFVQTLIEIDHPDRLELWQQILASLVKLDYWFDNRNTLIHSGRGVSVQTMINQLEEGKRNWTDDKDKYKPNPYKACHPNNILGEVLNIAVHTYQLLGQKSSPYVGWDKNTPYYLYSQLREEICQQLI